MVLPKRPCGVCLIPDLLLTIFFYPPTIDPASCRDSATDCVVTHVPSWYVFQSAAGHRTSGYASRRMVHKMWCRLGAFPMPGLKLQVSLQSGHSKTTEPTPHFVYHLPRGVARRSVDSCTLDIPYSSTSLRYTVAM